MFSCSLMDPAMRVWRRAVMPSMNRKPGSAKLEMRVAQHARRCFVHVVPLIYVSLKLLAVSSLQKIVG